MKKELLLTLGCAGLTLISPAGMTADNHYAPPSISAGGMQVTPQKHSHTQKRQSQKIILSAPTLNIGGALTPQAPNIQRPTHPQPKKPHTQAPKPPPTPVHIVAPHYPTNTPGHPSGYVVVEFTVNSDGRTGDIKIIQAEPSQVFDHAAISTVQRWRFKPYRYQGRPAHTRVRQRINFSP